MDIKRIEYHRNGVSAAPFYCVTFSDRIDGQVRNMAAFVFEAEDHIAVIDTDLLARGITGGEDAQRRNTWRGDRFEIRLRLAIRQHQVAEAEAEANLVKADA